MHHTDNGEWQEMDVVESEPVNIGKWTHSMQQVTFHSCQNHQYQIIQFSNACKQCEQYILRSYDTQTHTPKRSYDAGVNGIKRQMLLEILRAEIYAQMQLFQ
jgi:pyruvate formate-lyase activating enzyme-like uncharacterized protein